MNTSDIEKYILNKITSSDKKSIIIISGIIHKELGLNNRIPLCCGAMRNVAKKYKYNVLFDTPSHNSSTYKIEYYKNDNIEQFSSNVNNKVIKNKTVITNKSNINIPYPTSSEVERYLHLWDALENYKLQEEALDRLFFELCPNNEKIDDILIKVSTLNDFYSTNIFSVFPVAKHIQQLNIDQRLKEGDTSLVNDIKTVSIKGKIKNFYSFATKYCSHHKPLEYPIYDSYVDNVLRYFDKKHNFANFENKDLKDYTKFKNILLLFKRFYNLNEYNLKEIDKYLWQLGKDYFKKTYGKADENG